MDSQIVTCLPEVITMVHKDVMVGCLGAGVAGYLTYRHGRISFILIFTHLGLNKSLYESLWSVFYRK